MTIVETLRVALKRTMLENRKFVTELPSGTVFKNRIINKYYLRTEHSAVNLNDATIHPLPTFEAGGDYIVLPNAVLVTNE